MPKLTVKPAKQSPKVMTALNGKGGTLLADAYSILCTDHKRITTLPAIKAAWLSMSKYEREQCLLFVEANSQGVIDYPYWFLTSYRNLDTGRSYRTVGCSLRGPGVSLAQLRTVVKHA